MAVKRGERKRGKCRFKLGDRVRFQWGFSPLVGVITEERGRLAAGRLLFNVRAKLESADDLMLELSEDQISPVRRVGLEGGEGSEEPRSSPRRSASRPRARKVQRSTRKGGNPVGHGARGRKRHTAGPR